LVGFNYNVAMQKLLVICGPTATGKTSLGVRLAKKFDGEIISADSRQVYQGMDIATGKDLPPRAKFIVPPFAEALDDHKFKVGYFLFEEIPVWMLNVVAPDQEFTAADYYNLTWKILGNIWQKNKLPILVGGTGFYIKAVINDLGTIGIGPDWLLRKELQNYSVTELQNLLKKTDPKRLLGMNDSDRNNPRRLVRAIEVGLSRARKEKSRFLPARQKTDNLTVCLTADKKELYQRIDKRINRQLAGGAKEEIERLIKKGYSWDLPSMSAMGYRQWREFFAGKRSEEEVIQRWKFDEHDYARRQLTWFRKMSKIKWIDIVKESWQKKVEKLVEDWYS